MSERGRISMAGLREAALLAGKEARLMYLGHRKIRHRRVG
jgi:hypothetical protein